MQNLRSTLKVTVLSTFIATISMAQTGEQTPAHGLDLPASFKGTVSQNGNDVTWHLSIGADQSFQLNRSFGDNDRSSMGRWTASPTDGTFTLRDGAEMPLMVQPSGTGLAVIDANTGTAFETDLVRDEIPDNPPLNDMLIAGMMTYFADAATIEECSTGATFPIAQEGDYLALERAYLENRTAPGSALFTLLEGGIETRPAMEGPDKQTIIVNTFLTTNRTITCEREMADANIQNTYWRLTELDGQPFPMDATSKEPHIVLETNESQSFRATVGCNQMRGQYELDENTLSFSPVAMTMMACPPPLDTLENQFTKTLSQITSFDISGSNLVLKDQSGTLRALFTAQYF